MITDPQSFLILQKRCIEKVRFYVDKANAKLNIRMPMPKVRFGIEGTTAGRAYYREHLVTFNPTLFAENVEHFLIQTVGHEVGHLAAFRWKGPGIRPHGEEWANVMWYLGLPATRCHNYEVGNVPSNRMKLQRQTVIKTDESTTRFAGGVKVVEFND
jgi:SprT protein